MDIKLDLDVISPTLGDAIFINAPLTKDGVTTTPKETVAQRLRIRLLTFQNEWFADTTYGIPYYQQILGKKPRKATVDQIFQQAILSEAGVKEITSFESTFSNRVYSVTFRVRVEGGETDNISISL